MACHAAYLLSRTCWCSRLPAGPPLYIQRCEVQPFTLTLHYRPHRVDLAALSRWGAFRRVVWRAVVLWYGGLVGGAQAMD